jgi:hypothetical protein
MYFDFIIFISAQLSRRFGRDCSRKGFAELRLQNLTRANIGTLIINPCTEK